MRTVPTVALAWREHRGLQHALAPPMSSNRQLSPLRLVAYFAGAVIVVSLFAPSAVGVLGPIGLFVMLVAVYLQMFKRTRGRPPKDAARRVSGYVVRDGYRRLPEATLLALAIWSIAAAPSSFLGAVDAAWLGAIAGLVWAVITRATPTLAQDVLKAIVGAAGFCLSVWGLLKTDECSDALPASTVRLGLFFLLALVAVALAVRVWKFATLRKAKPGAFFLAVVGLLDLLEFAIAPAGEVIINDLPGPVFALLIALALFAAALCAINPAGAEAMLGLGIAAGVVYLLLLKLSQSDVLVGSDCVDVMPQLVMVTVFALAVVLVGAGED